MKIVQIIKLLIIICLFSFPFPTSQAESSGLIKLAGYQFDPLVSLPALPPTLKQKKSPISGAGYYILQFDGPVKEEWKEICRQAGVEFFDYIPDLAFIVRMNVSRKKKVESLPNIRWLGIYEPAYRLRNKTAYSPLKAGEKVPAEFIIVLFPGSDVDNIIGEIEKAGGEISARTESSWKIKLKIKILPQQIESLALLSGVKWVEEAPEWRLFNNKSREVMEVDTAWNTGSYYGAGQIVGVADTGLDKGSTSPSDLLDDFENGSGAGRVLAISTSFSDYTTGADYHGHGTHVAGSVLGNGTLSGASPDLHNYPPSCYAGVAPEASLVFQALGYGSKIPADLNLLFAQAYGGGVRIHNNSWGFYGAGEYSSYSEDVDEFSWDNKNFLILFAAGNDGIDANFDGVIDLYSVGPPATAKNCITVGATENDRPPDSTPSPAYPLTWGWYWPFSYPADPISDGFLSDNPDGMAAFSSRGAQLAARWKPELVAPGTNVISCRTQAVSELTTVLWGSGGLTGDLKKYYVFSGGTSMSTPLVTGSSALVRQYYTDKMGVAEPSAALIKATLINGAKDISPGQYGAGQYQEIPDPPRPNNVEGWGRVDLGSTIFSNSSPDFYYYDVVPGLTTGASDQYSIPLSSSLNPLSVTLTWTDHPGSTPANGALVNDLDLTLTGPTGKVYYPNNAVLSGPLAYDDEDYFPVTYYYESFADSIETVRFTPTCYPATIERGMFLLVSKSGSYSKTFEYRIYNSNGGAPQFLLASGTSKLMEPGWHIIDLSHLGITINKGDFHLGIVLPDDDLAWAVDFDEPIAGRSWEYMNDLLGWVRWTTYDYVFRAVVSCPTLYDRTNNTVGIDIEYPNPGNYTVSVSGYNVPYGPQPYALVISRPDRGISPPERLIMGSGDYNGDGTSDIAVYRWASGLWAIRDITRAFYGSPGDLPVPGDYNGDGKADIAIFRPEKALWSIRDITRVYFGGEDDIPVPADYNGDGRSDIAIFRENSGLWAVRGLSRFYYGKTDDIPVPGDYNSLFPGLHEAAIFRPSTGLWAIRGLKSIYFGGSADTPVPAHYDLLPGDDIAIYRPSTGLWAVYDYSRYYYGATGDTPVPADYLGVGRDNVGIFRESSGLWAIRYVTRVYFGQQYDIPVTR